MSVFLNDSDDDSGILSSTAPMSIFKVNPLRNKKVAFRFIMICNLEVAN